LIEINVVTDHDRHHGGMTIPLPVSALRQPLRWLPDAVHNRALAWALNHLLRGQALQQRLHELDDLCIRLDIRDAETALHFRIRDARLTAAAPGSSTVTIRGDVRDFIDLATRREDADTLFFKRRICIEGDTEAGLHVKNLLDSLTYDWAAHVHAVLPERLADRVINVVQTLRNL
jgi:predicted lipid carrier protein YhbT